MTTVQYDFNDEVLNSLLTRSFNSNQSWCDVVAWRCHGTSLLQLIITTRINNEKHRHTIRIGNISGNWNETSHESGSLTHNSASTQKSASCLFHRWKNHSNRHSWQEKRGVLQEAPQPRICVCSRSGKKFFPYIVLNLYTFGFKQSEISQYMQSNPLCE